MISVLKHHVHEITTVALKTADGDFVEETTLVDGKKVLGLDSKRGISTLEKRNGKE